MDLATARLRLREFHGEDLAAVHAFAADPAVTRYTDWGPNRLEDTAAFLAGAVADAALRPRVRYALAICQQHSGAVIGSAELRVVSGPHRRGEIGYVLARQWWGSGYATEAAGALLQYGFEHLGLHKISATCDPDNVGSAHVLTKVGMVGEGHLREHLRVRDTWKDRLLYAQTAP